MAQYKENSTIDFVKDIVDGKSTIRVSRRVNNENGEKSVDIRKMYTDDEGELQFTQKGIRVSIETAHDIVDALDELLSEE